MQNKTRRLGHDHQLNRFSSAKAQKLNVTPLSVSHPIKYPLLPPHQQVYADPDVSLSLLVGWDSPEESNGADILSYLVELAPSSMGLSWSEPYVNVSVLVDDAATTATTATVGGKASQVYAETLLLRSCNH